jgi:hypothetical protein
VKLPGWTKLDDASWQHESGVCIHVSGLATTKDGLQVNGWSWPESRNLDRWIRINGGNRKRGVMAWASGYAEAVIDTVDCT